MKIVAASFLGSLVAGALGLHLLFKKVASDNRLWREAALNESAATRPESEAISWDFVQAEAKD